MTMTSTIFRRALHFRCSMNAAEQLKQRTSATTAIRALAFANGQSRRFSTPNNIQSSSSSSSSLRSMIKPFLLKCHPDVQTSHEAKEVNLKAIQNLHGYMDSIQATLDNAMGIGRPQPPPAARTVEVDFLLALENKHAPKGKKKKKGSNDDTAVVFTSRRKVELVLPPKTLRGDPRAVERHAASEITKLLRIAGMSEAARAYQQQQQQQQNNMDVNHEEYSADEAMEYAWQESMGLHDLEPQENQSSDAASSGASWRRNHFQRRKKTPYEINRDRFVRRIDWKRVNEMYHHAVEDMHADIATLGAVRDSPERRLQLVARILSKVRVSEDTAESSTMLESLASLRRLSLLLEEHFEHLHLEELSYMWENTTIVLTPPRQFNTSRSALYKRRRRQGGGDNGFSFKLHSDMTVTMCIPTDFRDEELVDELNANVWDFHALVGDGMESLFRQEGEVTGLA